MLIWAIKCPFLRLIFVLNLAMTLYQKLLFCGAFLLLSGGSYAQFDNINAENEIYADYIESVQFNHNNVQLSMPIIDLNSGGRLRLQFDDREGGFKNYTYHLIHCDKDWNYSNLDEIEYIDGFNGEEVDEFGFSVNSYSEYTNYQVVIPNDDIRWTISGNYLLVIYDSDLELPILSRRFIVTENAVSVGATFVKPRNLATLRTHQELEILLNLGDFRVFRPQEEIFVTVMQNGNDNNAFNNLQSNFSRGDILHFQNFNQQVSFAALKEFRACDIRTLNSRTENVISIDRDDIKSTVIMDLGKKRSNKNFQTEPDANGGYVIDNNDFDNGEISSEYVDVIFSLEVDRPYLEEIYLVGSFCDWKPREKFKLEWNAERNIYLKKVSLKQGYYDYMFGVLKSDGILEMADIEGSWYETENDYQIITYYRGMTSEYDRVIDVNVITSNPNGIR